MVTSVGKSIALQSTMRSGLDQAEEGSTYQLVCSERRPPMSGPTPFENATEIPYEDSIVSVQFDGEDRTLTRIPWYFPLSLKDTTSDTITCPIVGIPPPPIPEI
jgi:hypothetical protein